MAKATPDFRALGLPGLSAFSGRIYEEWLPELSQTRGRKVFREMQDNDPVIGAILFSLEMLLRHVDWTIQPGTEDQAGTDAATFIDEALHDMENPWEDTLAEVMSFLPFGWSLHELVYKQRLGGQESKHDDGKIGWAGWPIRGQETLDHWEFDDNQRVRAMVQLAPPTYSFYTIPLDKALLFRTTVKKGNPEGRSILRNAYVPWYRKKHIEAIEGIGIERDLAGLPVAYVPPELLSSTASADDQAQFQAIKDIVQNIRRDEQEGIVWPLAYDENGNELYKLELLHSGGTRQFDTDAIITRYDSRIAMVVMADFLTLGHEKTGSRALASSKQLLFNTAIEAWLSMICAVVNEVAIPRLLRLNGMNAESAPTLQHGDIERRDLADLGTFMFNLAQAGIQLDSSPNGALARYLLTQADLPAPPEPDVLNVDPGAEDDEAGGLAVQVDGTPTPGQTAPLPPGPLATPAARAQPQTPTRPGVVQTAPRQQIAPGGAPQPTAAPTSSTRRLPTKKRAR